jgi:phosphatidate cytidylyltransferase
MAQQRPEDYPTHGGFRNLGIRLWSAGIYAPLVFAAVYFGSPWFDILIVAAAMVMGWEWVRMCSDRKFTIVGWLVEAGIVLSVLVLYTSNPINSLIVLIFSAGLIVMIAVYVGHESPARMAFGEFIIGTFAISFLCLRTIPSDGMEIVVWLVMAVWFTDTGGYFFGRTFGGPRLAPRISPNKTWSGLVGGIMLATGWSVIWLTWRGGNELILIVPAAISIAVLAQIGDLTVSSVKRRFGVKDSSGLIPGHGGLLDRLDGMLLTGPIAALVLFFSGKGWI